MKKKLAFMIMVVTMLCLVGCGKKVIGEVNPSFEKVTEDDISETTQIVELNNSIDYYNMNIAEDVSCVYFYSIGYDSLGNLVDKSVITTMPVGMETSETVAINGLIPNTDKPSYAIGFARNEKDNEYYLLQYDKKKGIVPVLVEEKESFFIKE